MSRKSIPSLAISALLLSLSLAPGYAGPPDSHGFSPVRVPSSVFFDQTLDNLRKLVSKNGMMVMGEVNQGKIMSMTGMNMKAASLLIGSPMVGKKLFGDDFGATVAAPFRVTVFEDRSGKTFISYFKPSDLLSSFEGDQIAMVVADLDQKLGMLTQMAGK